MFLLYIVERTSKMYPDEAEWTSNKIYKEACCANDHAPLLCGLPEVYRHHNVLFNSAVGHCSKRVFLNERSG